MEFFFLPETMIFQAETGEDNFIEKNFPGLERF